METAEFELIKLAQTGNAAAFTTLVERYARPVHRLALRFCRNQPDAEDLSQEVWLKAHKSIATFRFEANFYTWLRRILIHTFLNHRPKAETVQFDESMFFANSFDEDFARKILADRVRETLLEMSAQQRLIFLLKHDEGMTYDEIAESLNCSSGTIKKSIFRTVQKLREKFKVNPANN